MRKYVILAPNEFASGGAKTAHGVIRYANDQTVAIVDPLLAGKTVANVAPHLTSQNIPIVAGVRDALKFNPTSLLIGVAPQGGALPESWRQEIIVALQAGLEIVSGLHDLLRDDVEFRELAGKHNAKLWDVRVPPEVPLFSGAVYDVATPTLLTVGNDCAVGKMTVSLELTRAFERHGGNAAFVPTGQTGIMIAGWGICIDRVICDFAPGAAEQLILQAPREVDALIVEGQGSILHPAYAPVTLALLYGCAPDALLLVVDPRQQTIHNYDTPMLSYPALIAAYEQWVALVKPAKVVGIALKTIGLSEQEAREEIARASAQTGLCADDPVRFGSDALYEAVIPKLKRLPRARLEVPA